MTGDTASASSDSPNPAASVATNAVSAASSTRSRRWMIAELMPDSTTNEEKPTIVQPAAIVPKTTRRRQMGENNVRHECDRLREQVTRSG